MTLTERIVFLFVIFLLFLVVSLYFGGNFMKLYRSNATEMMFFVSFV